MMKPAELSVFQLFIYVISSIVHLRKHRDSVLIFVFADFHADWLVKSVTLHHEMSQDSQCNHHAYTQKIQIQKIQTNTNTNTSKNQIQMYICWLTGQECGIASWNLTGLPSVIISYNQGGSAQSTPLVLAAAVVIKYTNSYQALHLICGNRSNVEKGFNQLETFFFSTFPSPACLVSDFIIPRNLNVLACVGILHIFDRLNP